MADSLDIIQYYLVDFFPFIQQQEIGLFRGAINKEIDQSEFLAHNHLPDGVRYSYPLVQYGTDGIFTQIRAIGQGVRLFEKLKDVENLNLRLHQRKVHLQLVRVQKQQFTLQPIIDFKTYFMHSWLPFNQENVRRFRDLRSADEKILLLERILVGNILSMAKGCGLEIRGHLEVLIEEIFEQQKTSYKQTTFDAFSLKFKANIVLPDRLGLGKGVSNGFGTIHTL